MVQSSFITWNPPGSKISPPFWVSQQCTWLRARAHSDAFQCLSPQSNNKHLKLIVAWPSMWSFYVGKIIPNFCHLFLQLGKIFSLLADWATTLSCYTKSMAKSCCPVTVHRQFTSGHLFADFQVPFERLSLQRLKPWVINLTTWNRGGTRSSNKKKAGWKWSSSTWMDFWLGPSGAWASWKQSLQKLERWSKSWEMSGASSTHPRHEDDCILVICTKGSWSCISCYFQHISAKWPGVAIGKIWAQSPTNESAVWILGSPTEVLTCPPETLSSFRQEIMRKSENKK